MNLFHQLLDFITSNSDTAMQLISIFGVSCVSLMLYFFLCLMDYSYWHIFIRALFYNDFKPFDWLVDNVQFVSFLILFVGHIFSLVGLLQQFSLHQVHTKPVSFFIASPMDNFGLLFLAYVYRKEIINSIKKVAPALYR